MELNPYASPPSPTPEEGNVGLFIGLLLTSLAGTLRVAVRCLF